MTLVTRPCDFPSCNRKSRRPGNEAALYSPQLWFPLLQLGNQNADESLHRDAPEGINSHVLTAEHVPVPMRGRNLPIHRWPDTRTVLHLLCPVFPPALGKLLQVHHLLIEWGGGGGGRGDFKGRGRNFKEGACGGI